MAYTNTHVLIIVINYNTICIWNWQSLTCITMLTGHNHYVMYAMKFQKFINYNTILYSIQIKEL